MAKRTYNRTYVICEAGVNHNRSIHEAFRLCDVAKEVGADVVKFQLELPNDKTPYTLTWQQQAEVYRYCEDIGMPFACTAFDVPTFDFLMANTKMAFAKIASSQNSPSSADVRGMAANCGLPVIQSIPGKQSSEFILGAKLLHVVPEYPTPIEHCKLRSISEPWCSGLSDHSGNPLIPALAVALGAEIVEVHLTMSRNQKGPDHKASLDPKGFKQMVYNVRVAEKAL